MGLGGILDDEQAVASAICVISGIRHGCPNRWTGTIADRPRGDGRLDGRRVDQVVVRIDVDEDRAARRSDSIASAVAVNVLATVMTSSPGLDAERLEGHEDRFGAVGGPDAVARPCEGGQLLLEGRDERPVDEGALPHHTLDRRQISSRIV